MLRRKLDRIEETGADMVVVTDVSCGMHMAGGLRRRGSRVRVAHVADVLASTSESAIGDRRSAVGDRGAT
jgi:Fe-S oxidoreductase